MLSVCTHSPSSAETAPTVATAGTSPDTGSMARITKVGSKNGKQPLPTLVKCTSSRPLASWLAETVNRKRIWSPSSYPEMLPPVQSSLRDGARSPWWTRTLMASGGWAWAISGPTAAVPARPTNASSVPHLKVRADR
jgi:hypothetical protein